MFTQFTCNGNFNSHTIIICFGCSRVKCLIETALLRTQNMCCGLVKGGLDAVYSIYLEVF